MKFNIVFSNIFPFLCGFNLISVFVGIGYGSQVVVLYTGVYYIIILAWTFLYLFSSFGSELPWVSCNNSWNTGNKIFSWIQNTVMVWVYPINLQHFIFFHEDSCFQHSHNQTPPLLGNTTSSVVEFWEFVSIIENILRLLFHVFLLKNLNFLLFTGGEFWDYLMESMRLEASVGTWPSVCFLLGSCVTSVSGMEWNPPERYNGLPSGNSSNLFLLPKQMWF